MVVCLRANRKCISLYVLRKSATINVSLCDNTEVESAEECDIWLHWLELIVIQPVHSHTFMCAHMHTHSRWQSKILCVCVCHYPTSVPHWGSPTPQHACRITSRTIWKRYSVWWTLFVGFSASLHLVMLPSCWWIIRGSCGQFVSFIWGGFELGSHTLHSFGRNLITHKRNATSINVSMPNLNFQPFNLSINTFLIHRSNFSSTSAFKTLLVMMYIPTHTFTGSHIRSPVTHF